MKKKLLSLIAVAAAIATAGGALIACGGDNDGGRVVETEVTKEQWTAALNVESFSKDFKIDFDYTEVTEREQGQTDKYIGKTVFTVGAQKYGSYSVISSDYDEEGELVTEWQMTEIIGTEKDISYQRTTKGDKTDEWTDAKWDAFIREHEDVTTESWLHTLENMEMDYVLALADKYDSFNYESKQYVFTGESLVLEDREGDENTSSLKVTASEITLAFADGKLASCSMKMKSESSYDFGYDSDSWVSDIELSLEFTYGGQTVTAPIATPNNWNSELNGTYYRYHNSEYDDETYLTIYNGVISNNNGIPAEVKINGTNITVTFYMEKYKQVEEYIGTIDNGVINFTTIKSYKNGELIDEETNANVSYRKNDNAQD